MGVDLIKTAYVYVKFLITIKNHFTYEKIFIIFPYPCRMKLRCGPSHQNAAKSTTSSTVESIYYYAFKLCNTALHGKKQVLYVLAN